MSVKVLGREFLYEEGLGAVETIVDDPFGGDIDPFGPAVGSIGGLLLLFNENNRVFMGVSSREDVEAVRLIGKLALDLADELEPIIDKLEAMPSTPVGLPGPEPEGWDLLSEVEASPLPDKDSNDGEIN